MILVIDNGVKTTATEVEVIYVAFRVAAHFQVVPVGKRLNLWFRLNFTKAQDFSQRNASRDGAEIH